MSERDLDARLDAVERALTDENADLSDLRETTAALDDLDALESRVTEIETRLDELEAGLEAVRGYAGNVRAVNREVERRASAALAKAETLENAVEQPPNSTETTSADATSDRRPRGDCPPRRGTESNADGPGPSDSTEVGPQRESATDRHDASASTAGPPTDAPRTQRRQSGDGGARATERPQGEAVDDPSRRRPYRSDDRSGADSSDPSDGEDQTERFIERVRDAL
jgi:ABC-type transporter Mla subunit MlaD